jgi:hypothetical protein
MTVKAMGGTLRGVSAFIIFEPPLPSGGWRRTGVSALGAGDCAKIALPCSTVNSGALAGVVVLREAAVGEMRRPVHGDHFFMLA